MKQFYFLFGFIFLFTKAYSNNVQGYIVTLQNDTINVQLKVAGQFWLKRNIKKQYRKVTLVDSGGNFKVLTPTDIKGYGFRYKDKDFIYCSKPIKNQSYRFLKPVVVGSRTSLYQYAITTRQGQYRTYTQTNYTLEKSDGTYLFLTSRSSLRSLKNKLKTFYQTYPEVQQQIEMKFQARRHIENDLRDILAVVNSI